MNAEHRTVRRSSTLNQPFDPTDGSFQDLSVQFAGLGTSTEFLVVEGRREIYTIEK